MSGDVIAFRREPPTLPARLLADGKRVAVWCRHCCEEHIHGAAGIVDGRSAHRVAHCIDPESPYSAAGYFLQMQEQRS